MIKSGFLCAFLFFCCGLSLTTKAQYSVSRTTIPLAFDNAAEKSPKASEGFRWLPGLRPDADKVNMTGPALMQPIHTASLLGDSFWMGTVTTQSYNQGKVGRYYYWDAQGNLRGSLLFLDIAGKNKRGLKLVFPRHRAMVHP